MRYRFIAVLALGLSLWCGHAGAQTLKCELGGMAGVDDCRPDSSITINPATRTVTANPAGAASGDLSGSYPDPAVAKVNGQGCDAGFTLGPGGCFWTITIAGTPSTIGWTGLVRNHYRGWCNSVLPATNSVYLYGSFHEGTGWKTTTGYSWGLTIDQNGSVNGVGINNGTAPGIPMASSTMSNVTPDSIRFELFGLKNGFTKHLLSMAEDYNAGTNHDWFVGVAGRYTTDTNTVDGFQMGFSSGNFANNSGNTSCTLLQEPE